MTSLFAMGLPKAGKTTFLAALWHVAESEEVPGSLKLERISENAKHLNSIRADWLSFSPLVRTVPGQEQTVTLWFRDDRGKVGEVIFPDLSGESFQGAWEERHWKKEYDQLVKDTEGLLLFLNPDTLKEPYTITEVQRMGQSAIPKAAEEPAMDMGQEETQQIDQTEEWDPEKAPTQVQLVDLLQFVDERANTSRTIRVAVIISAWDLVQDEYKGVSGAQVWLEMRTPYLDQYLKSNFERFDVRVYGVSAQGGDLKANLARLQEVNCASDRIVVLGPDCSPHDISEPVRWCLGLRNQAAQL